MFPRQDDVLCCPTGEKGRGITVIHLLFLDLCLELSAEAGLFVWLI